MTKTFRYAAERDFSRLLLSLLFAIISISSTYGAVPRPPISVGPAGVGPFTFDDGPFYGWSTRSVPGTPASVGSTTNTPTVNQSQEDLAVSTNLASGFLSGLATDTNPTAPQGSASTSGAFRWNSARHFLESRPVSNDRAELLLTLRNDSGTDRNTVVLYYDFGVDLPPNFTDIEDPGLYGYRVYWSLTGTTNSWTHIPELDTAGPMGAGPRHVQLTFPDAWKVGTNLYFLWIDDNGQASSTGTISSIEGPYTIDNLSVLWGDGLAIYPQPHDIIMETCRSTNLTVFAAGIGSLTYQWYKESLSNPIAGATRTTLDFVNAQLSDAGTYFVVVTGPGAGNSLESDHVTVTINQDLTQPDILSAIGVINGTNVVVTFSEPMFAPVTGNSGNYRLHPISGSSDLIPFSATLNSTGTVLTLSFSEPRMAGADYELLADASVTDACGNPLNTDRTRLWYEIIVMPLTNTLWNYSADGQNLGTDWYGLNYDASSWQTGYALFDGKEPIPRTSVSLQPVLTQLPLHLSSGIYSTSNIPVYYFRTHFTLPVSLSHVRQLLLRPFVDDFDVVYLNGSGTPVHFSPAIRLPDNSFFGYLSGTPVGDANFTGPYAVELSNLIEGSNLIAVKLFQSGISSEEITLGYEILVVVDTLAGIGPGPQLSISENPETGAITLTWPSGTGSALYEIDSLTTSAGGWSVVAGASDGSYSFTPPTTGGTQKFYLLRK